jgi:ribose transport system substrate-binding protein
MKKTFTRILSILIVISGLWSFVLPQEKLKIAMVPRGAATQVFWKAVQTGAKLAAVSLSGVEILWKSPATENNKAEQVAIVEQCVEDDVSGIILSPLDYRTLKVPIANAIKKKIPILIFNYKINDTHSRDYICIVGIDNKKAGNIGGEQLAKLLDNKGKVLLSRYEAKRTEREDGILDAFAKHKSIHVTVSNHFANGVADNTIKPRLSIIDKIKDADGVICLNEATTMDMLQVLQQNNIAGKIKFIGFDSSAPLVEALKNREINALIAQDPAQMGYRCVKTMVDYIRGKKISSINEISVRVITLENLNDPEIKKILTLQ